VLVLMSLSRDQSQPPLLIPSCAIIPDDVVEQILLDDLTVVPTRDRAEVDFEALAGGLKRLAADGATRTS
jgi:hypothetical protein